jgi:CBS domain containing-hemolysin-like protein
VGNLIWIVVAATATSCFFGLTNAALRVARRARLEEVFAGAEGQERLELLDRHMAALRLATSFLRTISNLGMTVSLLYLFQVWTGGPWALAWALAMAAGITMVFSIVIPQAWAAYGGERVLRATLGLLLAFRYALWPMLAVMLAFDLPIRRLHGVVESEGANSEAAKAEILQAASEGHAEGAVGADEVEMIESVMEFGRTRAGGIMTPRTDLVALPVETPWRDACRQIVQAGHTRVPVYEGDLDNIIGVLYAKDLLQFVADGQGAELRQIMRKPYFVPETKPLDDLLREFKRRKVHIAVVLDEYGGTAGIATIEDVLEEIVGSIADEYDSDEPEEMKQIDDTTVEVDGRMRIGELNDAVGLELPDDEDYDTVAGFVFAELGYIPQVGERLDSHAAKFTVLAADERKIIRLRVQRLPKAAEEGTD